MVVSGSIGSTLNRVQPASRYTRQLLSRSGWLASGHQEVAYFIQVISLDCVAGDQKLSTNLQPALGRSNIVKDRVQDREPAQVIRRSSGPSVYILNKVTRRDRVDSYRAHYKYTRDRVMTSTRTPQPLTNTVKLPSTRFHLKECSPRYRQIHKVRKETRT